MHQQCPLICLRTEQPGVPGSPCFSPSLAAPLCCGTAGRTDGCGVFCKGSLGLALTLSHLSELCKIFPYGLLAT